MSLQRQRSSVEEGEIPDVGRDLLQLILTFNGSSSGDVSSDDDGEDSSSVT